MVVASFYASIPAIQWQWGEAYFAQKLDYEYHLTWVIAVGAGTGCDVSPYFRVLNLKFNLKKSLTKRQPHP
jgi:deoxyribodipyrimidine photolyase